MSSYDNYLLYYSSKLGRKSFILKKGEGSVMLSAPHAAEQTRNGRKKYGEYITGVIVNMLHDELNVPIICKEKNCGDDANRDEKCRYKSKLKKYVEKNGIKYLIDVHQMNSEREEYVDIGTGEGKNVSADPNAAELAVNAFISRGIENVFVDKPFSAVHPFTVSAFIARECGITALQIELNTRIVSKRYKEFDFENVMNAFRTLIKELNERVEKL